MDILQYLTYGVVHGAIYTLVATGLALIMGIMGIFNLSHGSLAMIAAYCSFWFFEWARLDPFISIPLIMIIMFIIGVALYKGLFATMGQFSHGHKLRNSLLVSFGLVLILENIAVLLWTANERRVNTDYSGAVIDLMGLRIPYIGIGAIALAILVVLSLNLFLKRTFFGRAIWAISQDYQCAQLMGVNVDRIMLAAFGIGVSLTAVAGAVISNDAISPSIGLDWVNKSLILVVMSGVGSIVGVLFSGLLLGVVEALSAYAVGAHYTDVVGLIMFLLILMFRPQGLFGKREKR
jgi:branched-chain amino acid transport system permease protein